MSKILVCYYKDGESTAQQLRTDLLTHFGNVASPLDVSLDGTGQLEKGQRAISNCEVLVFLVTESINNKQGGLNIFQQPSNPCYQLIRAALIRRVPVVPLLISEATLPTEQEVDKDVKALARLHSFSLTTGNWKQDSIPIKRELERFVTPASSREEVASAPMTSAWPELISGGKPKSSGTETTRSKSRIPSPLPQAISRSRKPRMVERGASRPKEDTQPESPDHPQIVRLGLSAPSSVKPGNEFTARFIACLEEAETKVKEILHQLSPSTTSTLDIKRCQWLPGTTVVVALAGRWFEVDEPEQSFIWQGPHTIVDFDVYLKPDAPIGNTVLKVNVVIEGIRVAKLRMDVKISPEEPTHEKTNSVTTEAARTAFASYSSIDRQRVIDRLASIRVSAGIEVFLDCLSLRPGEEWKPRLAAEIEERDQFLLFWSKTAKDSEWVTWEWQTALHEKGISSIQIHPLENNVPPPAELSKLHFGDAFIALRDSY